MYYFNETQKFIEKDIVNGEYYVDSLIGEAIELGLKVKILKFKITFVGVQMTMKHLYIGEFL